MALLREGDAEGAAGVSIKTVLWTETIRARVEQGQPHFLERASLKALSAPTSTVLFDVAVNDLPDLIVLTAGGADLAAPALCRRLREDARTRGIPILAVAADAGEAEVLREAGCNEVVTGAETQALQERICATLGMRLRRHVRYPVVLPVARGRLFREFLGYSTTVSEGGMGFDTLARVRVNEFMPLRIYRNTEEKPIRVTGRVAAARPNIDTGIGYAIGVEFMEIAAPERGRLMELLPRDTGVAWVGDEPLQTPPADRPSGSA